MVAVKLEIYIYQKKHRIHLKKMNIDHKNKIYSIDGLSIKKLANDFGTPCFVYSESTISNNFNEIKNIFNTDKKKVFYSVKANSNLAILKLLNDLGSGFDIVSMGELERVMRIGANPKNIVYSCLLYTSPSPRD